MKVINGKWQDQYGEPVDHFNAPKLMEIGQKVKAVYGDDITSNRIDLISRLNHLSEKEENGLNYLLSSDVNIAKLAGY
jgi:hypothetical protein